MLLCCHAVMRLAMEWQNLMQLKLEMHTVNIAFRAQWRHVRQLQRQLIIKVLFRNVIYYAWKKGTIETRCCRQK